ncbi:hypothetical protein JCM8097_008117 [Rhodosporidiobolus ruineniae]
MSSPAYTSDRKASRSPYTSTAGSTSSSSLWTASSGASSSRASLVSTLDVDPALMSSSGGEEDSQDEQIALELLDQLERERERVVKRCAMHAREVVGTPRQHHGRHESVERVQEDVFGGYAVAQGTWSPAGQSPVTGPSTYQKTRRPQVLNAPKAIIPSGSLSSMNSMSTLRVSSSSNSLNKRSSRQRRASFTRTDIAELDIDAILDAYGDDFPVEEPVARPPSAHSRRVPPSPKRGLPRSKSTANLRNIRHDIFPAPPIASPSSVRTAGASRPALTRTTTSTSSRSANASNNAMEELFPHRRVAPFPTMGRKKSSTSLRSTRAGTSASFDPSQAPPLPPMPSSASIRSSRPSPNLGNRTFSSFARQSTCSTASTHSFASTASSFSPNSPPLPSSPNFPFLRQSYASSSASSSRSDSIRWSVATSSTAPSSTAYSDAGDSCSRRGSVFVAPSSPASSARRGSTLRFRLADEAMPESDEEDEDDVPLSRLSRRSRRDGHQAEDELSTTDDDETKDHGGLISWEDFAQELEGLAPPPTGPTTTAAPFKAAAARPAAPFSPNSSAAFAPRPRPAPPAFAALTPRQSNHGAATPRSSNNTAKAIRSKLSLATLRAR